MSATRHWSNFFSCCNTSTTTVDDGEGRSLLADGEARTNRWRNIKKHTFSAGHYLFDTLETGGGFILGLQPFYLTKTLPSEYRWVTTLISLAAAVIFELREYLNTRNAFASNHHHEEQGAPVNEDKLLTASKYAAVIGNFLKSSFGNLWGIGTLIMLLQGSPDPEEILGMNKDIFTMNNVAFFVALPLAILAGIFDSISHSAQADHMDRGRLMEEGVVATTSRSLNA